MNKLIATIATLFIILSTVGCSSNKDPVAYNNEVITVINGSDKHISEMNTAMTSRNYDEASRIREEWEKAVNKDIQKMEKLGDFNGDDKLQQAVLTGLKGYKKIVEDDYTKLIEIRKNNSTDIATEQNLLDNINDAFEKMANGVNQASDQFAREHLTNK